MPLSNGVSLVHLYLVNQGQSVRMLADGGVSQDGSGSGQIVTTTSGAPWTRTTMWSRFSHGSVGGEMEGKYPTDNPSLSHTLPLSSWPRLIAPAIDQTNLTPSSVSQKLSTCLLAPHLLLTLPINLQPYTLLFRHQQRPVAFYWWHSCLQYQLLTINTQPPSTIEPRCTDSKTHPMYR